ncbi:MAG: NAD(P)H-dependent glycerol-3-phosphate dehydrogenase [Planctomycetota bacterium]
MKRCLVLGSGSFAAALAHVLKRRGAEVTMLCRREERAEELRRGEHGSLPGVTLASGLEATTELDPNREFHFGLSVVPTQRLRSVLEARGDFLPRGLPWISASKGIEIGTGLRPSEILAEFDLDPSPMVLSGPSHAEEVALDVPTAVVLAGSDAERAGLLQEQFSGERFRVYVNSDPIGVEWAGALKNVIALASGIAVGQGFGDNTLAALITRGAVEIARFGVALGGQRDTFHGLSGIGDLIVTCFSDHSRNRSVGVRLGRGESVEDVVGNMTQVAEGVPTTRAVVERARQLGVELPIAEEVFRIVHEGADVTTGVEALLSRSLKSE